MSFGTRILNKDIFFGTTHLLLVWWMNEMMIGIVILLHWDQSSIDFVPFSCTHLSAFERGDSERGALVGGLTLLPKLGVGYQGVATSSWFLFLVFSLACISRLFVILIEFFGVTGIKGVLGSLIEATIHQNLARNSHLIEITTFIIIKKLINMIQVSFSGKFSDLWFSHAFPITNFTEKTLVGSRKNHQIDLHWEYANSTIWVLSAIIRNLLFLLGFSHILHFPTLRNWSLGEKVPLSI